MGGAPARWATSSMYKPVRFNRPAPAEPSKAVMADVGALRRTPVDAAPISHANDLPPVWVVGALFGRIPVGAEPGPNRVGGLRPGQEGRP
jgi:hypothetical protein